MFSFVTGGWVVGSQPAPVQVTVSDGHGHDWGWLAVPPWGLDSGLICYSLYGTRCRSSPVSDTCVIPVDELRDHRFTVLGNYPHLLCYATMSCPSLGTFSYPTSKYSHYSQYDHIQPWRANSPTGTRVAKPHFLPRSGQAFALGLFVLG
jgi:hypothetical protein